MSESQAKKTNSKSVSQPRKRPGLSKVINNKPNSEANSIRRQTVHMIAAKDKPDCLAARGTTTSITQLSRTQRRRVGSDQKQDNAKELPEMIKALQCQVVSLKSELDKANAFNAKLASDLAAAQAKITTLTPTPQQREAIGEYESPKFKDIQKLIANKLELKKEPIHEPTTTVIMRTHSSSLPSPPTPISQTPKFSAVLNKSQPLSSSFPPPPPPLPPPPPPPRSARAPTNQKTPALLELYRSLTKQEPKRDSPTQGSSSHKNSTSTAHNSIVGEIQNRSAHLLAIKSDIQTKGDFINGLISKVLAAAYTDIEDVLKFADWLDGELSSLADERAVLKHFTWPERKADALREAAIEYRELKLLEREISSYKYDINIPCSDALKKMASLLDKSERSIQRLVKLRSSVFRSYQEFRIPTDWMLDSGIMSKIKQASMNLVRTFMKRVTLELESIQNSDRESSQESLVLQGVNFAYRAHQFTGGLDSETLCTFEAIRQRLTGSATGSQELLAAIPSS